MSRITGVLVGALVMVNLGLVGLLLFREKSVPPAQAEETLMRSPAGVAPTALTPAPAEGVAAGVPMPLVSTTSDPSIAIERSERVESVPAPERPRAEAPPQRDRRPPRPAEPRSQPREETRVASTTRPEPPLVREPVDLVQAPPPPPLRETITVPAGTHIEVRLDVGLHSRQVRSGDTFEASLARDLIVNGRTLGNAGDEVTGRVTDVMESGRVKGRELMKLALVDMTLGGKTYPINGSVQSFEAEDDKDRDAAIVGGSTVVGAILGGISKGKKGAATGAAGGAAAGAGVVLATRGKPVVLASGTRLDFTLQDAIRVSVARPMPSQAPAGDDPVEVEEEETEDAPGVARRY